MGEAPSIVYEKAGTPAEDVAVVPGSAGDKLEDRFVLKGSEEKPPAAPEFDKKTFSSDLTPSGMLTATGVSAERVSKIFAPPREAPLSSSKKEAPIESKEPMESPGGPIVSTTYVASDSNELGLPATLLIRAADPSKTQKDIMDKAMSLGGAVASRGTEESKEKNIDTPDTDAETVGDESGGAIISLPPEKMGELLDYLAARYPEADKDITDLKARKTTLPLRIDVGPVTTR
jgi:hypothetical protein